MRVLITGATGMVGSEVVRQALIDSDIASVTVIVRSPLKISHDKLTTIIHPNFLEYQSLTSVFQNQDVCIWCLGISQFKVREDEYNEITYDYAVSGAQAMLHANPNISFVFLSGMGADNTEDSKALFARVKGKTENALDTFPFKKLYFARPGGIRSVQKIDNRPFYEKIVDWLYPILNKVAAKYFIDSRQLAIALLRVAKKGYSSKIIDNAALKEIASK